MSFWSTRHDDAVRRLHADLQDRIHDGHAPWAVWALVVGVILVIVITTVAP